MATPIGKNAYFQHWHIDGQVFTAQSQAPYLSAEARKVFEQLYVFCQSTHGLVLVGGGPGVGKSTMLKLLATSLDAASHDSVLISLSNGDPQTSWLFPRLQKFFGITATSDDTADDDTILRREVLRSLDDYIDEGRRIVVMVDDAEHLRAKSSFQELGLLLKLQNLAADVLSFVLVFNTPYEQLPSAQVLSEEATLKLNLPPLNGADILSYLDHQLLRAGLTPLSFSPEAHEALSALAPIGFAQLNKICEQALMQAYVEKSQIVTPKHLKATNPPVDPENHLLNQKGLPAQGVEGKHHKQEKAQTVTENSIKLSDLFFDDKAS